MPESPQNPATISVFSLRSLRGRVLPMTLLWLGLGVVVGALSGPAGGGWRGIICGVIAGMILLPWIGAFLGLIGGSWRETLGGGFVGLMLGLAAGTLNRAPELPAVANMGLLCGALIGATFFSYVSHVRKGIAALQRMVKQ